jgi:hypothetical protein
LTASAGISYNAMLAKICSDLNKPNGQYILLDEDEAKTLIESLPVRKVGGIGNVTEQLLRVVGVETCRDIYEKRGLIQLLYSELSTVSFLRIALGIGCTDVGDMGNRERKSMSTETTFRDTSDPNQLREICGEQCTELAADLQYENLAGRQVTVKIKTHKFALKTRVVNLHQATADVQVIKHAATKILNQFMSEDKPMTLRLLGVRMSDLLYPDEQQSTGGGQDQATLDKFFNCKNLNQAEFECPICGDLVKARNEAAFSAGHFEKCLVMTSSSDKSFPLSSVSSDASPSSSRGGLNPAADSTVSTCQSCDEFVQPFKIGTDPTKATSSQSLSSTTRNIPSSSRSRDPAADPAKVSQSSSNLLADHQQDLITCPVCGKFLQSYRDVNSHIDECLNRQMIGQLVGTSTTKKRSFTVLSSDDSASKRPKMKNTNTIQSYFTKTAI